MQSFGRSKAMFAAIQAILAEGFQPLQAHELIAGLGEYKSRGKGGKHRPQSARQMRVPNSSKYHAGNVNLSQECARRVRQMARCSA